MLKSPKPHNFHTAATASRISTESGTSPDNTALFQNLHTPEVIVSGYNLAAFSLNVGPGTKQEANNAEVFMARLDPSTTVPQIILDYWTGGAHCCTATGIATVDPSGTWYIIDAGQVDGDGGFQFTDLIGDGASELVGNDDSFRYAFDCYACSFVPTRIKRLVGTELRDVSQDSKYSTFVHGELERMEQAARSNPQLLHSNGYLAAWVAQKGLLGEVEDAWSTMLASYDRNSKWTLQECLVADLQVYKCPPNQKRRMSFPEALAKHLIAHGYPTPKQVRFQ